MTRYILILLLILGIVVGIYLVLNPTSFSSKAAPELTPKNIQKSNLTDNSFTVSWITPDKPTVGILHWGKDEKLKEVARDDRDEGSSSKERFTHHITVKKLDPTTTYYFSIGSGSKTFDDQGRAYSITTAPSTENPPAIPDPLFGKVLGADDSAVDDGLIYISLENGSLLSSYTREGKWLLTLNNSRSLDLKNYLTITKNSLIDLKIEAGKQGSTSIKANYDQKNLFEVIKLKNN